MSADGQDLPIFTQWQSIHQKIDRRFKPFEGLGDVAQGLVGDLLSLGMAVRADAEEHDSARTVQESASRLHGSPQFPGGSLEFQVKVFSLFEKPRKTSFVGGDF
jgi:hypothetical protein